MSATTVVFATYASVLVAEIAGDRSLYTVASLASRFRARPVLLGVAIGHGLKMAVAVLLADALQHIAAAAIAGISCVTWLLTAWALFRREADDERRLSYTAHPSIVAFASITFTEWADPGHLTAALLAVHFHSPLLVWIAATAAILTKAVVAMIVGAAAREFLNGLWLRLAAAAFCLVNAAASIAVLVRARS